MKSHSILSSSVGCNGELSGGTPTIRSIDRMYDRLDYYNTQPCLIILFYALLIFTITSINAFPQPCYLSFTPSTLFKPSYQIIQPCFRPLIHKYSTPYPALVHLPPLSLFNSPNQHPESSPRTPHSILDRTAQMRFPEPTSSIIHTLRLDTFPYRHFALTRK